MAALAVADQPGHVQFQAAAAVRGNSLAAVVGKHAHIRDVLRGQPATRCAERGDVVEQPILGFGAQVHQQSLGDPRRRLLGVKTAVLQRSRPVIAKIDTHRTTVGGRGCAQPGQGSGLELDHPRLVDLVYHRARRPRQPIGLRVEAGRQDDGLADARCRRVGEEAVEVSGAHRHSLSHPLRAERGIDFVKLDLPVDHPGEGVDADRVHQRLGEGIVDQRVRAL
jgi:hypothetical protein